MEVTLAPEAAGELEALDEPMRALRVLERLAQWPNVSGARPLSKELAGPWRIRTGDYRVMFRVEGQRLVVAKIGHRDRFYEKD